MDQEAIYSGGTPKCQYLEGILLAPNLPVGEEEGAVGEGGGWYNRPAF